MVIDRNNICFTGIGVGIIPKNSFCHDFLFCELIVVIAQLAAHLAFDFFKDGGNTIFRVLEPSRDWQVLATQKLGIKELALIA